MFLFCSDKYNFYLLWTHIHTVSKNQMPYELAHLLPKSERLLLLKLILQCGFMATKKFMKSHHCDPSAVVLADKKPVKARQSDPLTSDLAEPIKTLPDQSFLIATETTNVNCPYVVLVDTEDNTDILKLLGKPKVGTLLIAVGCGTSLASLAVCADHCDSTFRILP